MALNETMRKLKKRSLSIDSFDYENKNISDELQDTIRGTVFLGVSGEVKFTEKGYNFLDLIMNALIANFIIF